MGNVFSSLFWNKSIPNQQPIAPQQPASDLSSHATSSSTEPCPECQDPARLVHREVRKVPTSYTISFSYDYGRRVGAKEAEAVAEKKYADLSAKSLAGERRVLAQQRKDVDKQRRDLDVQKKGLDEQKRELENMMAAHQAELASTKALAKREADGARMATRKLHVTLEQERHKMDEKLNMIAIRHSEEKRRTRLEQEQRIARLQDDLAKLNAQNDKELLVNTLNRGAARRCYDAESDELRAHVNVLEERLQSSEAELKMARMILDARSANQQEHITTGSLPGRPYDQGHGSQLLAKQNDEPRAHVNVLKEKLQAAEAELKMTRMNLAAQLQMRGLPANQQEQTWTGSQRMFSPDASVLLIKRNEELQQLQAKIAWLTTLIRGLQFSLCNHRPERQLDDIRAAIARAAAALTPPPPPPPPPPPMSPFYPAPSLPSDPSQVPPQGSFATPLSYVQQVYPLTGHRSPAHIAGQPPHPPVPNSVNQSLPNGHTTNNPIPNAWTRNETSTSGWDQGWVNSIPSGNDPELQTQSIPTG
ncbi:MAG: hypothetical protein Q9218_004898 [Villophora microphyllina]